MFGKFFSTKSNKTPKTSSFKPGLENLEARQLMAAGITASLDRVNGINVLTITGTDQSDSIYIDQSPRTNRIYAGTTINGEQIGSWAGDSIDRVVVYGLGGNDYVNLNYRNNVLNETNPLRKPATLSGGDGNDTLYGGAGDDWIDGGAGNDSLYGGDGADLMAGQTGTDYLFGQAGNDVMYGGGGGSNPESGGADRDYLYGGDGADSLFGGGGADFLYGDAGSDALYGNSGDDYLMGGTGYDKLFGGSGIDKLYGENSTFWGSNWQRNWLEAGSASETAVDGWNAHKPVVNGTRFSDIDQENSGTCVLLSSLAAVTRQGADLTNRIQYLGNFKYRVSFENGAKTQDVFFDGNYVTYNGDIVDANSHGQGESWTIIYQRAYLKKYFKIDPMNADDVHNFDGEDNGVQAFKAIGRTHIINKEVSGGFTSTTRDQLRSNLASGYAITVGGTGHRYALFGIEKNSSGVWTVELYNPWGSYSVHTAKYNVNGNGVKGTKMAFVNGSEPGRIKVTWNEFKRFFNEFTASAR